MRSRGGAAAFCGRYLTCPLLGDGFQDRQPPLVLEPPRPEGRVEGLQKLRARRPSASDTVAVAASASG
jgi:hypothetical protein